MKKEVCPMRKFGLGQIAAAGVTAFVSVVSSSIVLMSTVSVLILSAPSAAIAAESQAPSAKDSELVGGDRVLRAPSSLGRNVISRKRYPGGADEDDLQVQESLPIPSRTYDGTVGTTSAESTTETESPAHD